MIWPSFSHHHNLSAIIAMRPNWPPIPQRKVYWRADIPRQVTIVRSRCGLVSCYPAHRNCSSRQLALIGEYQQARQECKDCEPLDEMFFPHTEFERYRYVSQAQASLRLYEIKQPQTCLRTTSNFLTGGTGPYSCCREYSRFFPLILQFLWYLLKQSGDIWN